MLSFSTSLGPISGKKLFTCVAESFFNTGKPWSLTLFMDLDPLLLDGITSLSTDQNFLDPLNYALLRFFMIHISVNFSDSFQQIVSHLWIFFFSLTWNSECPTFSSACFCLFPNIRWHSDCFQNNPNYNFLY